MDILERLFPKKKHARVGGEDDDTDPSGYTRIIVRDAPPAREAANPWGPEIEVDRDEEPVLERPAPRPAVAQLPRPPAPVARPQTLPGASDDKTVIGQLPTPTAAGRVVGVLVCCDGPVEGHVCRIFEGENVIGRQGRPDPLPNTPETKTISREHARLKSDGQHFVVEPMQPENATFVNDVLIEKPELVQHGDRIRLGATKASTFVLLVVP